MKSRLFNSHQAHCGARLAGLPGAVRPETNTVSREPSSQAPKPGGFRGAAEEARVSSAADHFALTLTPNVQATLLLAAQAEGVTPGEFIARSIVMRAREAVGFPALCDSFSASCAEGAPAGRRTTDGARSGALAESLEVEDLHDLPAFMRVGETRFRTAADRAGHGGVPP